MTLTESQSYVLYAVIVIATYLFVGIDDHYKVKLTKTKYFNRLFSVLIFIAMFVLITYRNCGVDTPTYEYSFIHNRSESNYDIVFFGLLRLVRYFTDNVIIWQGIMGGITLLGIWASSERLKEIIDRKTYLLFATIYLYFFAFNYSRMLMSVGVLIFAMSFLTTKNYAKYVMFNVVAGLIHYTSFSVLLVFALYVLGKKHRNVLILIGVVGAVIISIRPDIISFFTISDHYSIYLSNRLSSEIGIGTLVQIFPYFLLLMYAKKDIDNQMATLMYILLIGNVAFGFLGYAIPVASRIARFTFTFPCMFIPSYIIKCRKKSDSGDGIIISSLSVLLSLIVYFGLIQRTFETIGIVPYTGR